MATMKEIDPQEGDVIRGAFGPELPVCVVRGELFWNGQFVSTYDGDGFEVVSRSGHVPTEEDLAKRAAAREEARKADELDPFYS
jgi:hypothetical protein